MSNPTMEQTEREAREAEKRGREGATIVPVKQADQPPKRDESVPAPFKTSDGH